jgi:hypothetical protein
MCGSADALIVPTRIGRAGTQGQGHAQNAIDLARALAEGRAVAILSAMESVSRTFPRPWRRPLVQDGDRGQITGAVLDGRSRWIMRSAGGGNQKIVSPVASRADVIVVPDLQAGNMLAKSLSFLAGADRGHRARRELILTSRADSVIARLASCAVAMLVAASRRADAPAAFGDGRRCQQYRGLQRGSSSIKFAIFDKTARQDPVPGPIRKYRRGSGFRSTTGAAAFSNRSDS